MAEWFYTYMGLLVIYLSAFPESYGSSVQRRLEMSLSDSDLCPPTGKKQKITLSRRYDALVVTETRSFDNWPGHVKFHCQFEVKDAKDNAVFAVIQNIRLRREGSECIDYVEIVNDQGDGQKYCGEHEAISNTHSGERQDGVSPLSFIDEEGEMTVTIHVARKKLLPEENLALKIAFTSAKKCWRVPGEALANYIPCSSDYCIPRAFANDSIVNCPFTDCRDESGCPDPGTPHRRPSIGSKVTIGAITTVLVSFLLFFACIWLLRHYRKMCWAADAAWTEAGLRLASVPPAARAGDGPASHGTGPLPSAPPAPDSPGAGAANLSDKDLPPSYDSLFPAPR